MWRQDSTTRAGWHWTEVVILPSCPWCWGYRSVSLLLALVWVWKMSHPWHAAPSQGFCFLSSLLPQHSAGTVPPQGRTFIPVGSCQALQNPPCSQTCSLAASWFLFSEPLCVQDRSITQQKTRLIFCDVQKLTLCHQFQCGRTSQRHCRLSLHHKLEILLGQKY